MNIKLCELMTKSVITAQPHYSIEHVRQMPDNSHISSIPVVDSNGHPVGIVSLMDLVHDLKPSSPISGIMTNKAFTTPNIMMSVPRRG